MRDILSTVDRIAGRYSMLVRYLISGGTSFGTNIVALYLLKEYTNIGLSASVVAAFVIALIVSFLMMKHVTFQDSSKERKHKQMISYCAVAIFNLFLNWFLVSLFVERFNIWYILAQIISSLLIAMSSFLIYKHVIFVKIDPVAQ